jgi:hypothetical protein
MARGKIKSHSIIIVTVLPGRGRSMPARAENPCDSFVAIAVGASVDLSAARVGYLQGPLCV